MDFSEYLIKGRRGHLVGIGGVSMAPLAEVLHGMGLLIGGSDIAENERTEHLREKGMMIVIGQERRNITPDIEFVVRTAAAHDDNPEIAAAHELGIPVFERAQAWGAIMKEYENALCIAGTHGKTTTTSMCAHILMAASLDPTVMIGGTLPLLKANHRVGSSGTIVMESCEYYRSFLSFFPTVAAILNVELDHVDYYKDLDDVKSAFRDFALRVPADGTVVANLDDANTMACLKGIDRKIMTFGMNPKADVSARNVVSIGQNMEFDVVYKGSLFTKVTLHQPGMHNVMNALAAIASCICLGVSDIAVRYGLAGFGGAERRFQFKGKYNGADVYDDYAHHPSELEALLNAVEGLGYKRTVMVFQPHTYTRTEAFTADFVEQLKRPDVLYIAEIFAAREKNELGVSSRNIADKIDGAKYFRSFDEAVADLREEARPGDLILTVGAGNVYKIGEYLLNR